MVWSTAVMAADDAGDSALRFIEKARAGELDLKPGSDTALSAETTDRKRKLIASRLERFAEDIGDNELELADTRVEGGFAAALVRATSGFDPAEVRVFAIALVKRGDRWLAAPVPASFENTGAGYAPDQRRQQETLREWMLREQALEIERIKDQMSDRLRREISRSLPASELQAMSATQAARRFIDACAARKLPEILGLLGGLSQQRPDDWPMRLKAAEDAAAGESTARPWRLLVNSHVLRAVVRHEEENNEATITLGCLDPSVVANGLQTPRVELLALSFTKSTDGLWRCDPSADFYQPADDDEGVPEDGGDEDLLEAFVEKTSEAYPPQPHADAAAALDTLLKSLKSRDLPAVTRLLPPGGENTDLSRANLCRAAHVWWILSNPADPLHAMRPSLGVEGDIAAAVCQFFSARNPDRPDLRVFYFQKSADGWFWLPIPDNELELKMRQWVRDTSAEQQANWRENLLAESLLLDTLPESAGPDKEAAERVVREWIEATRAGDAVTALRLTARLAWSEPDAALRNLGYEITGNRMSDPAPKIIHHLRAGIWSAVGAHTQAGGETSYPLYPVIQTPEGPRILIEIDLFAAQKRSRDFLNKNALANLLGPPLPDKGKNIAQATDDLRQLLRDHEKMVAKPEP